MSLADNTDLKVKVMASANRALLGAVTKNLRAVTAGYNPDILILRAYFDTGATDEDKELPDIALTEIAADLWQDIKQFKYEAIDLFYPDKMDVLNDWIYLRREPAGDN